MEEPFDLFDQFLKDKGYLAMASAGSKRFSPEGKRKARRARNETIHEGETPEDWKSKLAKNRQKDKDARLTRSMNARIPVTRTRSASIAGTNSVTRTFGSCAVAW